VKRNIITALAASATVISVGCGHPEAEPLEDVVLTYAQDGTGAVTSVGFTVTGEELDRVMAGEIFSQSVQTYDDTVIEQTYIKHIEFGYNPHGHGPPGVNDVPHFDVHFYGITNEERLAIVCGSQPVPEADLVPPGYDASMVGGEPFGSCVPAMGTHAGDEDSVSKPLDAELLFGYDQGKLIFIEPMIHADYFKNREAIELSVARPAKLGRSTTWPDTFTMSFDDETGLYHLELTDFSAIE